MLTDGFSKVTPLADAYLLDEKTIHVYSKHALIQTHALNAVILSSVSLLPSRISIVP